MVLEKGLLEKAGVFFAKGFKYPDLTPSQMSGIGERVKSAISIEDAKARVLKFLDRQLDKLEVRKERSGKSGSWLIMSKDDGVDLPLGKILWKTGSRRKSILKDISTMDAIRPPSGASEILEQCRWTLPLSKNFWERHVHKGGTIMSIPFGHHELHNRYCFEGELELVSPLRISSGRASDETDAPFMRMFDGTPYIPGTSLRGAIRSELERILAVVGESASVTSCILFEKGDCAGKAKDFMLSLDREAGSKQRRARKERKTN